MKTLMNEEYYPNTIATHSNTYDTSDANYHEETIFQNESSFYLEIIRGGINEIPYCDENPNRVKEIIKLNDFEAFEWLIDRSFDKTALELFDGRIDSEVKKEVFSKNIFEIKIKRIPSPFLALLNQNRLTRGNKIAMQVLVFNHDQGLLKVIGQHLLQMPINYIQSIKQTGNWDVIDDKVTGIKTQKALSNIDTFHTILKEMSK